MDSGFKVNSGEEIILIWGFCRDSTIYDRPVQLSVQFFSPLLFNNEVSKPETVRPVNPVSNHAVFKWSEQEV